MPENRHAPAPLLALRAAFQLAFFAIPLAAAGRLDWIRGWIFAGTMFVTMAVNGLVMLRKNPGLLRARLEKHPGTKPFDRVYTIVSAACGFIMLIVAGLDARFGLSAVPWGWLYAGLALHLAGMVPATAAMAVNPFLERTVRIQSERGHALITSGPYRYVRHPMYAGYLLAIPGWPLILGSWWAFIPAGVMMLSLVVRTPLEDRTLRRELPGYEEYARLTRYRLLPGIW